VTDWSALLAGDEVPALELAERLADDEGLDICDAQDRVYAALGDALKERGDGHGLVTLADSGDEAGADAPDVSKYRRVHLDAADRAGRESWEFVEEEAVRAELDVRGFAELIDSGRLSDISGWRFVDVSADDEDSQLRWYYSSGDEPRPDEFRRFHELLLAEAPADYTPHYFRVSRAGKAPATQYGGWKQDDARLTVEEAVAWMEQGGNVGVAGRPDGPLINVDIDDDEETTPADVPTSLRARSRSRTGWHTWYFDRDGAVPNIPTDEFGEVRTDWQYVVAPGSFVASAAEDIPDGADDPGYYTVEDEAPVAEIAYDDLPQVFRDAAEAAEDDEEDEEEDAATQEREAFTPDRSADGRSAVFNVEAADLVGANDPSERFTSIFHDSGTGSNMSVSGDKLHCWRHGVAHGGLQALATLSDEVSEGCRELGAAHKNSGAGRNRLKGDWQLVWAAWVEAKRRGRIPTDDPVPYRVLREIAVDDGLVDRDDLVTRDGETGEVVSDGQAADTYRALPPGTYNRALAHIENKYDVSPGRDPIGPSETQTPTASELDLGGEADSAEEAAQNVLAMMELQD